MTTDENTPTATALARAGAAKLAREALQHLDHDADDVLIVADWIITGRCDVAIAMAKVRAENCARHDDLSPDAARWIPDETDRLFAKAATIPLPDGMSG